MWGGADRPSAPTAEHNTALPLASISACYQTRSLAIYDLDVCVDNPFELKLRLTISWLFEMNVFVSSLIFEVSVMVCKASTGAAPWGGLLGAGVDPLGPCRYPLCTRAHTHTHLHVCGDHPSISMCKTLITAMTPFTPHSPNLNHKQPKEMHGVCVKRSQCLKITIT